MKDYFGTDISERDFVYYLRPASTLFSKSLLHCVKWGRIRYSKYLSKCYKYGDIVIHDTHVLQRKIREGDYVIFVTWDNLQNHDVSFSKVESIEGDRFRLPEYRLSLGMNKYPLLCVEPPAEYIALWNLCQE